MSYSENSDFGKTDLVNGVLVCTIIVLILFKFSFKFLRHKYYLRKIPGPSGLPIIGNAFSFYGSPKDVTQMGLKLISKYSPIFKIWIGPLPVVVVTGSEAAEVILKSPHCLDKSDIFRKLGCPFMGDPILMSKVSKWKRNRNIVIRGFSPAVLRSYFKVFVDKSVILVKILQHEMDIGKSFDINKYISKTAMDSICASAIGVNINAQRSESKYFNAVERGFHLLFSRGFNVWKHPDCIYNLLSESKQLKDIINIIWGLASQLITEKRNNKRIQIENLNTNEMNMNFNENKNPNGKPLLDFLIDIIDTNSEFTDDQLRDEINLIILAGYETSSNAISYNLLCLAARKDIQDKVYAELHEVFGDSDRPIDLDDLPKLQYLDLVIKESMRLFPTIPLTLRQISKDMQIGDTFIPGGLNCIICQFQIHRDENNWKNPLHFDPDRFLVENTKTRHPYAYIPFSAGARNCIGMKYSMMFMKTVLSTVLRKYEFHTNLKLEDLTFCVELSLKLIGGHQVFITPRNKL